MRQQMLLEREKDVLFFHTDQHGHATISALCRFAQESAWYHAEALGLGFSQLSHVAWALREQTIRMLRYPSLGERLHVQTWATRFERLFWYRDFRILDSAGAEIAFGTSVWFVLDLAKRRPIRADSLANPQWPPFPAPRWTEPQPEMNKPETDQCSLRTVRYSELDVLGHMNNLHYLSWITDHLTESGLNSDNIRTLRIRYVREVTAGDTVEIRYARKGQEIALDMRNAETGKDVGLAWVEYPLA